MKQCDVCERDIHRNSFANHLRTDGPLLESGERNNCLTWELIAEKEDFGNHLTSYRHKMNRTKMFREKEW